MLAISRETRLCEEYQGQYPVVFLTLKGVEGRTFDDVLQWLTYLVSVECLRLSFLLESEAVEETDKQKFSALKRQESSEAGLKEALVTLMRMLHAHYGKQVILLIDEYDVPLDKANCNGYYDQMISFLRGFFGEAFKTNPDLYFAVVTGCLHISKESIFTGINNLKVDTITDKRYDEYYDYHENYYHTLLAGLVMNNAYRIRSNAEMRESRSDIAIEDDRGRRAVIIGVKRATDYDLLERESERAIAQIKDNHYA